MQLILNPLNKILNLNFFFSKYLKYDLILLNQPICINSYQQNVFEWLNQVKELSKVTIFYRYLPFLYISICNTTTVNYCGIMHSAFNH